MDLEQYFRNKAETNATNFNGGGSSNGDPMAYYCLVMNFQTERFSVQQCELQ